MCITIMVFCGQLFAESIIHEITVSYLTPSQHTNRPCLGHAATTNAALIDTYIIFMNLLNNKRVKDAPKGGLRRQKLNLETRKEMLGHPLS